MRYDKAEFKAAYGTFGQLPDSDLPEIAFAGRSNVGKSSLLNKLFQRKNLARVSSVPGKTITIKLNMRHLTVHQDSCLFRKSPKLLFQADQMLVNPHL